MNCTACGKALSTRYIRAGDKYFCSLKLESDGYFAPCFEEWAYSHYPKRIADYAVEELLTGEHP